jgi:hypothetical protein
MPSIARPYRHRLLRALLCALAVIAGLGVSLEPQARASTTQIAMIEPGGTLMSDPVDTLHTLRLLGVREIRLFLPWHDVVPAPTSRKVPRGFNATNPSAYPRAEFAIWDQIDRDAKAAGIGIDLDPGGRAPLWAMPKSAPVSAQGSLYPNATLYGQFVEALGKRYSGTFTPRGSSTPLPRVTFWSIWNEPNYISSLQPQARGPNNSIAVSPMLYRGILAAGWNALAATGHGSDTILIGELAPRGFPNVGHGYTWPVQFVRDLYCVDSHYHQLRSAAASQQRCPTNSSGSARFRSQNPGLFDATGLSDHPYSRWLPPNEETFIYCRTGLCASLGDIGELITAIDRAQLAYGSHRKLPIYSTEYGYQTSPPRLSYDRKSNVHNVSQATAAAYINWAEYISYKNPRVVSYDQYLLKDPAAATPANNHGSYASGLEMWNGHLKPGYSAFRLPLYLPRTSASAGQSLEVWGCARPAYFASLDSGGSPQPVNVQFAPRGSNRFTTVETVAITNTTGYFDVHVPFHESGTVRLSYEYPLGDLMLAPGDTVYSRSVTITIH